ncbi:MAG TPA: S8 family serine peptidase [Thermoanaerobaculia bacterium]
MNRCLHITIHEDSRAASRRAGANSSSRTGDDPATNYVLPPVDDPGTNYVLPPVDDPGTNYVLPPVDDPGSNYVLPPVDDPSGLGYTTGGTSTVVHASSCCCCCGEAAGPRPESGTATPHPFVASSDFSGFVIVRMAPGINPDAGSLWELANRQDRPLPGLKAVLELPFKKKETEVQLEQVEEETRHLTSRPLVELQGRGPGGYGAWGPLPRAQAIQAIRDLEERTAVSPFPPLHSLNAYWRLDLRDEPGSVDEVVKELNRLAEVDLAYRELASGDPQTARSGQTFAEDQGYLDDAPLGIGAFWAWESLSGTSTEAAADPLTICDLEQHWNPDHQDLKNENVLPGFIYGVNRAEDEGVPGHHGTAVLGQLAAAGKSPQGVKGAAAGLGQLALASHYRDKDEDHPFRGTNGHVAAAIAQALAAQPAAGPLKAGDILLLEVQLGRLPAEVDEANFDAIRLASGCGVIVIEAAGNGGFDLDAYADPATGRSLARASSRFRDSGAVMVGAARASLPHDRAPFSNYGSRLDCFAWGEAVTTCGFGDLAGTAVTDFYTNSFNGTSSASPIIAGAAALVQALHKKQAGFLLDPRAMRSLLSDPATGTRQGPNVPGFIGVMPDLKAVVRGRLQLVEDVYMRRSVGDDGSALGPDDEISSSPDIIIWTQGAPGQTAAQRFGEGPRANHPALGNPIDPDHPDHLYTPGNDLYIRLRNRGGEEGKARVELFASPAATLITPERWMPICPLSVQAIPQGDTLTVSDALPVNDLPQKWLLEGVEEGPQASSSWLPGIAQDIVPAFSFLAVQRPWKKTSYVTSGYERTSALPPGPPYFDWAAFRSFLRGRGVTWRNVHPILAKSDMTLAFLFAGTPDRIRHFDFEVIQRLPAGVEVTLIVPPALAAKLRQRQPWLANGSGVLSLPRRPRTALKGVALAPGACAHAAFRVEVGTNASLRGHSLAIRQLWRGEEVGRITWWFIDP